MRTRLHLPWVLIIILILATCVRLYDIQLQSIWFDEGWSAYAAIQPTLQGALQADPTNPPLYYGVLNAFTRGFGDSAFSLRFVSTLFGLLIIPLSYQLGRRLFNERAGIAAAALTAFSPLLWWASQEIRMYTLLALVLLVAALAWHTLLRRSSLQAWLALWLSELAILYTHNTGPVVVSWLSAITLLAWVGDFVVRARGGKASALSTRRSVMLWIAGQIGVALLWSPWFITKFLLLPDANSAVSNTSPMSLALIFNLWQPLWEGAWAMVNQEPLMVILSAMLFVVALVIIPWRRSAARWLVLHVVLLTGGIWLGLTLLGNEIHGRYLVMVAPLILVVLGAGVADFPLSLYRLRELVQQIHITFPNVKEIRNSRPNLRRWLNVEAWRQQWIIIRPYMGYFTVALLSLAFLASVHFVTTNPAYQHDDAHGMVQYYAARLTAKDTVLDWSYADRYELAYYWPRLNVKARRVTLPEGADLDAVLPLLPKSGDVALNVWYTQRADYRGMMDCILSNGTINLPEEYSVYGMSDRLYRAPSLDLPHLAPANIAVDDMAAVTAVGGIAASTGDQALCLPLKLTLTQATNLDLKAAVIVRDGDYEIAHADAIFADAAQETTSQLEAGNHNLTAYPLVRLPYGTPAGVYSVWVRIYDEHAQPSGYDLSDAGAPHQKDVQIGSWKVVPGARWEEVNRASGLPVNVQIPAGKDLMLIGDNLIGGTYRNGDALRLALLWRGSGALPDLTLADQHGAWSIAIPAPAQGSHDSDTLDWRDVQIPPDATAGTADVRLPDGTVIGSFTIQVLPALYTPPPFDTPFEGDSFPGIGKLAGFSVSGDMTKLGQPFTLTLVWQAAEPSAISYTVFGQLVTEDGRVLAQSDSLPMNGDRPTTGWRAGEYIVDAHQLTFHPDASAGSARLIVGFYDAATSQRVATSSGANMITLQTGIVVR